ncbi:hypothetical protein PCANC_11277 [Puccinia coronata f. sp. avenae]|uniref:U1-type domain-containing protein n=1 Tax=Puccinia coronata f. sp. avenae TaxID=200324 RepID=A0A2N5T647_9BASI|nr:hypothetical protein PCANC_11277 [Puccinia coronata f. sp. avenae]
MSETFETNDYVKEGNKFCCKACPMARGTVDWRKHCATALHKQNKLRKEEATRLERQIAPLDASASQSTLPPDLQQQDEDITHAEHVWNHIGGIQQLNFASRSNTRAPLLNDDLDKIEARNEALEESRQLSHAINWQDMLMNKLMVDEKENTQDERPIIRTDRRSDRVNSSVWYPFKSELDLIASMLIGHTHTLLSRSLYSKIRAILSLLNIQLPAWATREKNCVTRVCQSSC